MQPTLKSLIPVKKFQLNYLKELKLRRKMFLKFLRRPKYLCLNSSFFNTLAKTKTTKRQQILEGILCFMLLCLTVLKFLREKLLIWRTSNAEDHSGATALHLVVNDGKFAILFSFPSKNFLLKNFFHEIWQMLKCFTRFFHQA